MMQGPSPELYLALGQALSRRGLQLTTASWFATEMATEAPENVHELQPNGIICRSLAAFQSTEEWCDYVTIFI